MRNILILLRFVFLGKDEKPNDINGCIVKSDRLLGLDRVREAARQRKKERFTALLHHVNPDTLRTAFHALRRKAAPGVDGVMWDDYEAAIEPRLADLHARIHRGA